MIHFREGVSRQPDAEQPKFRLANNPTGIADRWPTTHDWRVPSFSGIVGVI
jgi:hypothetical protein